MGDDIFIVEDLGNNRIKLTPTPTHVSEAGTPVNKALLQPIENELATLSSEITTKVDKVSGKGLSANDFTNTLKSKLDGIQAGAQVNRAIASKIQAEAGVNNTTDMTPLRVAEAFDNRIVFAQVNQVFPGEGTVTRLASSPTDYNTIKFTTLLQAGDNDEWFGVNFPSLGDVVVGTPQYNLTESPTLLYPGTPAFKLFQPQVVSDLRGISTSHGIESFGQTGVRFILTRESGTGALTDIYLHFRFTGLKLA